MYLAWERGYSECPIYGLWENERQLIYNFSLMWTSCSYRSLFWSSKHKFLATVQEACLTPCLVTITGIMQRAVLSLKCLSFGCLCWKLEVSEPHCPSVVGLYSSQNYVSVLTLWEWVAGVLIREKKFLEPKKGAKCLSVWNLKCMSHTQFLWLQTALKLWCGGKASHFWDKTIFNKLEEPTHF